MQVDNEEKEKLQTKESINSLSTKDSKNSFNASSNFSDYALLTSDNLNNQLNSPVFLEMDIFHFDFEDKSKAVNYSEEYLNEIYTNLIQEEKNLKIKPILGYMLKQPELNENMRIILIDWIIKIHYKLNLTSQTLYNTVFIIDTYLSIKPVKSNEFQLLGLTAFLLACKAQEVICPNLDNLINSTDGACDKESLFRMENNIVNALNFNLYAPSPDDFYGILSTGFKFTSLQKNFGKYIMEHSLYEYNMIKFPASVIAVASCYFVMKYFNIKEYEKLYSSRLVNAECPERMIKQATREFCFLVHNIVNCPDLLILKEKYASERYDKVSECCKL